MALLREYVKSTYETRELPLLAPTTQKAYRTHLDAYVLLKFGDLSLREMTTIRLQEYFSGLAHTDEGPDYRAQNRRDAFLRDGERKEVRSRPKESRRGIEIPQSKVLNRKKRKPVLRVEELDLLLREISEPYATMVNTAYFSGLRPSESNGLKIEDVREDSITVDEACCRGRWKETKPESSSATSTSRRRSLNASAA